MTKNRQRSRYFGIGKESVSSTPTIPRMTWPVIPFGHEACDDCGAIQPFDALTYVASYEDGTPIYHCVGACHD